MKAAAFEGAATDQRTVAVPATLQAPMYSLTALASPLVSALALVTGLVGVLGARFDKNTARIRHYLDELTSE